MSHARNLPRSLLVSGLPSLLVLLVLLVPAAWAEKDTPANDLVVLCEVWRATAADVVAQVEARTERDPADASAVRALLQAAGEKAERLSRLLTPTSAGQPVQHEDLRKVAMQVSAQSGGAVRGGFGGFLEIGTTLEVLAHVREGGLVAIEILLEARGADAPSDGSVVPGTQFVTKIQGTLTAPLGALRMFQSNVQGTDTVLVFVRVTQPDASGPVVVPVAGEASANPDAPLALEEIERFRKLKQHVDRVEREERYRVMVTRQLDRLGLDLTDEQTQQVIELTRAFRDDLRTAAGNAPSATREERTAAMEALRASYAEAIGALVSAADAEKIVNSLGRFPGSGTRRRGGAIDRGPGGER